MLYRLGEGIGSGLFKTDMTAGKMTGTFFMHNILGGRSYCGTDFTFSNVYNNDKERHA